MEESLFWRSTNVVCHLLSDYVASWNELLDDQHFDNLVERWSCPVGQNTPYAGFSLGVTLQSDDGSFVEFRLEFSDCDREPKLELASLEWDSRANCVSFPSNSAVITQQILQRLDGWIRHSIEIAKCPQAKHAKPRILGVLKFPSPPDAVGYVTKEEQEVQEKAFRSVFSEHLGQPMRVLDITWSEFDLSQHVSNLGSKSFSEATNWLGALEALCGLPALRLSPDSISYLPKAKLSSCDVLFSEPRKFYQVEPDCSGVFSFHRVGYCPTRNFCATAVCRRFLLVNSNPATYPSCWLCLFKRDAEQWTHQRSVNLITSPWG